MNIEDFKPRIKKHVEEVSESPHVFKVKVEGFVDGFNTRSPLGYEVYDQSFEPMIYVKMENIGKEPIVNPWIVVNGRCWRTTQDIAEYATLGAKSEKEKAMLIWLFEKNHRFHATTRDEEVKDPVKVFNIYGYTLCGDDSHVIADLWRTVGLRTRPGYPYGHSTTEVFYDGKWHLLDGDENVFYLLRDNKTVASEEDIVRDPDLVKRTHVYGILIPDKRLDYSEGAASLYYYEGERKGEKESHIGHKMTITLRPGEALIWRWDNKGKYHGEDPPHKWYRCWSKIHNGKLIYRPKLRNSEGKYAFLTTEGAVFGRPQEKLALHPEREKTEGFAVLPMHSPYPIVGGCLKYTGYRRSILDKLRFLISFDMENWKCLWDEEETGYLTRSVSLDPFLPPTDPARYHLYIKVELQSYRDSLDVGLEDLHVELDLQMAHIGLPALRTGYNTLEYSDENVGGGRKARISICWKERFDIKPPEPPLRPLNPPNGGEIEGTDIIFEWEEAKDPNNEPIVDYHFQLSDRPDMAWPLSPNFDRLISRTAFEGSNKYRTPCIGLLNPNTVYYWRVRARNASGVWSRWSPIWSFTVNGPGVPLDVRLEVDKDLRVGILRWRPNPEGRIPVKYEVYGSDEKGFTASSEPYLVRVDNGPRVTFPSNLIAVTDLNELKVIGDDLDDRFNKAYYRVVAVDEKGNKSGASDYAEAPIPLIYSKPPTEVKVGQDYRYCVKCIKSIGRLIARTENGKPYQRAFRMADKLTFSLTKAPNWLSIDPARGIISGRPDEGDVGVHIVSLKVETDKGKVDTQTFVLKVVSED
ncbi:hypothetical protein CW706_02155 [Candidatus Bathyarchaeota archaeon]|nr:MAG: hypothetical protein CW706_02155 [Candidatus Bathyarchaeota archaeon]